MKTHPLGAWAPAFFGLFLEAAAGGLVAYYPFDSDFEDASGSANHLNIMGGTPEITHEGGEFASGGGALNLVNAEGEWLDLASDIQFAANQPWSVSFWARRRVGAPDVSGMVMGDRNTSASFIWNTANGGQVSPDGGLRFRPVSGGVGSGNNDYSTGADTAFHHWVLVADGTGNLTVYLDNRSLGTSVASDGTRFEINTIGQAFDDAGLSFDGQLDEVHIFDEAVDAARVAELFGGDPPSLTGIVDDQSGGPVGPGSTVTYTVAFNEDMDEGSVGADDFGNAGTASFRIDSLTEVSPGVFSVEVTPTSAGTLQLEVLAGATMLDVAGNPLDTGSAIVSEAEITVQEGFIPAGVRRLRVVLVGGQSNADGRASPSGLPTRRVNLQQPQEDVDFYYKVEGRAPVLTTLRPGLSETNGFGPAITCGRRLADELADGHRTRVAVIKYANGGTNLHTQWAAGGSASTRGDGSQYVVFQQTVTTGLAELAATYPNAVIEVVGMVWLQGESDAGSTTNANHYETNLTNFITDVRLTYGEELRFVVIRLSAAQTAINAANLATIRAAQTAVAVADPLTGLVDSDSFGMKEDRLHFDALGQQQNGEASAIQLLNLYPFLSPLGIASQVDGDLRLTVDEAFEGFVYALKSSDTLAPGDWDPVEERMATGDRVEFTVTPGPGQDRHFFRVERSVAP